MVHDCWSQLHLGGWGGHVLKEKIKRLKVRMRSWNTEQFGDTFKKVQNLQFELNKLETDIADRQLTDQENMQRKQLQQDLWAAAQSYESLVRQKARSKWIREGDCNSRYFHLVINYNRRHNAVNGLTIDGSWVDEPARVKEEIYRFFQQRFQDPHQCRPQLNGISFNTVGQQERQLLVESFKEDEIRRAVWDCGGEKSPGPDGLNFKFIKHFWQLLKPDFLRFLDEFHTNGVFPKGSNASFISLIPKVPEPQSLNDFRPISLIGCTYKIVAKLLSNRLKKVMPSIIDERQSAFIQGRQLLHSVITVNEVVEEAKRGRKPCLVFKVD